ncbi:dynamin family protein [Chryseomicrobium palamuruense]|uniref:Dynamin family protein n=1 Tax=Chryseomicrobium palamuruense TaxID=682973 RepID=A0ABV8UVY3_9BACL
MNEQKQHLYRRSALLGVITEEQHNETTYTKTKKFAHKLFSEDLTIAFAGHFSAGKSSMINALTGENLLATSPIPTSANIVTIQKAPKWKAFVHFMNGDLAEANEALDVAALKRMAKDGQSVRKIELFHPDTQLPEHVVLMDTPGVDSTDDAHRLSTESELHLADLVFYVMDYNHVQSELNFTFTKELMRTNPNVYLIINQMDKHRETELSLEDYKASVAQSFESWDVYPKGIFFTSLKNQKDFPVTEVQTIIQRALANKEEVLTESAQGTLSKLMHEHEVFLSEDQQDIEQSFEEYFTAEQWQNKKETKEQLQQELQSFELLDSKKWKDELIDELQSVLKTAYLMTPDIRERIRAYAEASQPNFKVGFFSSKKKTEEERQARLEQVTADIQSIYQQTTATPINRVISKYARIMSVPEESQLLVKFFPELISQEFKPGTSATGDGLLQFSSRVEQSLKKEVLREASQWANQIVSESDGKERLSEEDQVKKEMIQRKLLALTEWFESEEKQKEFSIQIKAPSERLQGLRKQRLSEWEEDFRQLYANAEPLEAKTHAREELNEVVSSRIEESTSSLFYETIVVNHSKKLISTLGEIPNFQEAVEELKQKIRRIENKNFTIALFGAFSAGKSSFSNALLGEAVLPVSPNPTTASINKIAPVSDNKPHRHAEVIFKTKDEMITELKLMLTPHASECTSLEELAGRHNEFLKLPLDETKKSFIRAFVAGFEAQKSYLGTKRLVNHEAFTEYVAVESKSCFVETITYYYDCELTRAGVTLVDTPGADSINARHTGVAFDYIRNADAVLFITYYNHAFAKADREFLIQLGRVKDSFELDKMFFVVNAIDLANSEQEKNEVLDYVGNELGQFGIRFPRLYGVSSLEALREKQEGNQGASGMAEFEASFQAFLREELAQVALQSADEYSAKLKERFKQLIDSTEINLKRKPERLAELAALEQTVRARYQSSKKNSKWTALQNELETLIYYLKQRVFYRFPDFFKEAFNPSRFAKTDVKQAFDEALTDVLDSLRFDISQELRVTNLRMQQEVIKKVKSFEQDEIVYLDEQAAAFAMTPGEVKAPKLLEFIQPELAASSYTSLKKHYKNAKRFFEKNEKAIVQEELEKQLKQQMDSHLEKEKQRIESWTDQFFSESMDVARLRILHSALSVLQTERQLLEQHEILAEWKNKWMSLEETT